VWDYAGDGYVHRLIRNKADGKLVELPSAASSVPSGVREEGGRLGPSQADALSAEKIEAIGIEYSYLLTSQLDSQRVYYEEQLEALRTQVTDLKGLVDNLTDEFKKERERSRGEESRIRKEEAKKLALVLKEKTKTEHRAEKLGELSRRLDEDLKEEKAVSQGLMANLAKLREKSESDEKKVRELEEQSRDVMFFLDAQQRITSGTGIESEAAGGSIEVVTPPETANNRKKKKTKK
jgi:BRCA1-associated protein